MRTFVLCLYVAVAAPGTQNAAEPALRAAVEPLLESGKAHQQGADTLVVSD